MQINEVRINDLEMKLAVRSLLLVICNYEKANISNALPVSTMSMFSYAAVLFIDDLECLYDVFSGLFVFQVVSRMNLKCIGAESELFT